MKIDKSVQTKNKYANLKAIFNYDFIFSAIIPILIFGIFNSKNLTLTGVIFSACWSLSIILITFIQNKELNTLAALAGGFALIGLIGTIISHNPTFYFVSPIIQDSLLALLFFLSLLFRRSLIQIIVEQSYLKNASPQLKNQPAYNRVWRILTIAWGSLNVLQALIRIILLHMVSISTYFTLNTLIGNISTPLLLLFSIFFPGWYWKKAAPMTKNSSND